MPFSPAYGDVYHSADGGPEQARHVFVSGNGLEARWATPGRLVIVETGFGLGLNFLATWQAFRHGAAAGARLHFLSIEKHPPSAADLAAVHRRWPQFDELAAQLAPAWPPLLAGLHRLHFDAGAVTLTLAFGDAARLLPRLVARADAFYLDGFAPDRNPDMWSAEIMAGLARLAAPGATLATWTVAAGVRERLAAAGFTTAKRPGFGHKREMLAGHYTGPAAAAPAPPARRAVVVGAGMAGSCCAERLAARGWHVTVVERHGAAAQEASGNPSGVLLPLINLSDSPGARLSRACLLYAGRYFEALAAAGARPRWQASGVLQLARDAADLARHREIFARLGFPADFARPVDAAEGSALAGSPVSGAGWFFARGGWLAPGGACAAALGRHADRIEARFAGSAARLVRGGAGWQVQDAAGAPLGEAPVVVLANAADAAALAPGLTLHRVRGQISLLGERPQRPLALPVCRRGYATPALDGLHSVGATFGHDDADAAPRLADHYANLERLCAMLPEFAAGIDPTALGARVAFRATTPDRLPVLGALAGTDGLHVAAGLGARGLVWAPLAAEVLASRLEGDPLPVDSALAAALDPARFARRVPPGGA